MARPKKVITPELCELAFKLAYDGLSNNLICFGLSISLPTFYRYKRHAAFQEAISKGREAGILDKQKAFCEKHDIDFSFNPDAGEIVKHETTEYKSGRVKTVIVQRRRCSRTRP